MASERFRVQLPPEPSPLIGRSDDVARIEGLFESARLVTVVGPPGMGKTRLALHLAHRRGETGWFCDLSQARDRAGLAVATASGLGVPLTGDPLSALCHRVVALGDALIVLDNFEQVIEHAEDVEAWLQAAPQSKLLVTSRERLRLRSEQVVELSPLTADDEAVALLVDRIRASNPGWEPSADERPLLTSIAQALEGIPLALELAAARVDVLGLEGLLSRLTQTLEVLSRGARDQVTLRDAISWSWELLGDEQRRALARCSVFVGGFTFDAAEAVLGAGALDVLSDLRDRSLLRAPSGGRFALYQSIRAFAREHLGDDADAAAKAHTEHYLALTGAVEALAPDCDNLLAVAERGLAAGDKHISRRAALSLSPILATRGPARFHLHLLERVIALAGKDAALLHARALAHRAVGDLEHAEEDLNAALTLDPDAVMIRKDLGVMHHGRRELDEARECYDQALERAREQGERRAEGLVIGNLGALSHDTGNFEEASRYYADALDVLREVGDVRHTGLFLTNLGVLDQEQGRSDRARKNYGRALTLLQQCGDYRYEAVCLGNLGVLEHDAGNLDAARGHHEYALALLHEVGPVRSEALSGARLGAVLAAQGELAEAEERFDAAERSVLGRDAFSLSLVRLHRCFLDLAGGDQEAAQARMTEATNLIEVSDDARMVLRMLGKLLSAQDAPRLEIGPQASWFCAPGGTRESLEKYTAARRILDRLTDERLARPGEAISGEALFEAGWPGVTINQRSANNRLYVALAKLRKMGLKLSLLRKDEGYLLDPDTLVVRAE